MHSSHRHRIAFWSVLACAAALALGLVRTAAAERRGIDVAVVKTDGTRIAGELCAVRPNSVVVQEGQGDASYIFINVSDIRFIERAKISAWLGAATGLLRWGFYRHDCRRRHRLQKAIAAKTSQRDCRRADRWIDRRPFGGLKGVPTKRIATIDIEGQPREVCRLGLKKIGGGRPHPRCLVRNPVRPARGHYFAFLLLAVIGASACRPRVRPVPSPGFPDVRGYFIQAGVFFPRKRTPPD